MQHKAIAILLSTLLSLFCTQTALFAHGDVRHVVIAPGEHDAKKRLKSSVQKNEWVSLASPDGVQFSAWIVYPKQRVGAPAMVVLGDSDGLSDWLRGVADQLALEGFIAIVPDLFAQIEAGASGPISSKRKELNQAAAFDQISAAGKYAVDQGKNVTRSYGVIGFDICADLVFSYAASPAKFGAAIAYYGSLSDTPDLSKVAVPILGFFTEGDKAVTQKLPAIDREMKQLGKRFDFFLFQGAQGFLRLQDSKKNDANSVSSHLAWLETVKFLRQALPSK